MHVNSLLPPVTLHDLRWVMGVEYGSKMSDERVPSRILIHILMSPLILHNLSMVRNGVHKLF